MKTKKQYLSLIAAVALLVGISLQVMPMGQASAAQITNRSLTLVAGATDGGSKPGGVVKHQFNFTLPSSTSVGSMKFQYCTTAASVSGGIGCNLPSNMSTTAATLGNETGVTGFSVGVGSPNGTVILSRTASAIAPGAVSYRLDNITNPDIPMTFFVRISTYSSTDGSGSPIDSGTVAAATSTQIQLTGTMPESLVFCAGATIGQTAGVPDCSTVTTGSISFDKLFSPTDTAISTSQMAASTNAGQGYAITVNGTTLTSGTNTINAMTSTDTSKKGISQFGMNLKLNTSAASSSFPGSSAELAPTSNSTNYNGRPVPSSGYDVADSFKFTSGNTIADSNGTGTDAQIYTVSYITNVPGSQPAGTYTTTLTYVCTPTF